MKEWSNLAKVVYKRTYARSDSGKTENWQDTVERVIQGNVRGHKVGPEEIERLRYFLLNRKATPAGRGLWFSGVPAHERIGGSALVNCWFFTADDWNNYVLAQDLLMLGGGVGMSVEHRYVSKLGRIKKGVTITYRNTKDADFIVPDSREGWNELTRRVLESFFVTGKSFCYSTICIRNSGELIKGFGGTSSGQQPLIAFVEKLTQLLTSREGKHLRPLDASDILCMVAELVVAGNVRRSALMILGDCWDKEFLKAKRWDLGILPSYRSNANFSVVCDDVQDLHPLYWATYEAGEAFGIFNRKTTQTFGRMGERKRDTAIGCNPCVTGDTEILTQDGYKAIESLVDQPVEVWNGFEWSMVTPKITGTNQDLVTVTFNDGRTLTCTNYHNFHIAKGYTGESEIVEAQNLTPGMKLIKHKFPIIEHGKTLDASYLQGFQSAEGMDGYNYIQVYEPKYICLDERLRGFGGRISATKYGRKLFYHNRDLLPKTFVPFGYNLKSRLDWLSGLFDGDGCELKEGGLQLSSVDRTFLANVQKLLSTLGVQSKVVPGNVAGPRIMPDGRGGSREFECQEINRICVGAVQMQELKQLGLSCVRLKFDKTPQRDASQFITIVDITPSGKADIVYCFNEPKRHLGIFNGILTGQCAEALLEDGEPCNLQEIYLPNLEGPEEFFEAASLMHRWGKRITCEHYHHDKNDEVVKRNRRIGTGITGCLQSPLFSADALNDAYQHIAIENVTYSKVLGIPESIRTTVVKPSGTLSLIGDVTSGIHPAYSRHYIRRVRFGSDDKLIPLLKEAGHLVEPSFRLDNTLDHKTLVVDFPCAATDGTPIADEGFDTWNQLDTVLFAQKHWADQSVSVTVYYRKNELGLIKDWLSKNLSSLKTISFLCHNDHGFKQAPLEKITEEEYNRLSEKVKPIEVDSVGEGEIDSVECASGYCPIK